MNMRSSKRQSKEVFDLLKKSVRPEFLNRIDDIIMFRPSVEKDVGKSLKSNSGRFSSGWKKTA
jgi:ATP-dependent Clp protease ATP-binding subunit ClpA